MSETHQEIQIETVHCPTQHPGGPPFPFPFSCKRGGDSYIKPCLHSDHGRAKRGYTKTC